ncbi:MAG: Rieske (2Fe-2S) protein [Acidobacteriia bacterium]|nr:Rieske (2Fe-2S) protein [Terriglobia bacterium]
MPVIKIACRQDLPEEGKVREFQAGDKTICVACVGGRFSALENQCPHRGGPLGQGVIEKGKVVCPWHGWEFDAATGQVGHNPAARIATYPLTVEGEDVFVEI